MKTGEYLGVASINVKCPECGEHHTVYNRPKARYCWRCKTRFLIPQYEYIPTERTPHNTPFLDRSAILGDGAALTTVDKTIMERMLELVNSGKYEITKITKTSVKFLGKEGTSEAGIKVILSEIEPYCWKIYSEWKSAQVLKGVSQ